MFSYLLVWKTECGEENELRDSRKFRRKGEKELRAKSKDGKDSNSLCVRKLDTGLNVAFVLLIVQVLESCFSLHNLTSLKFIVKLHAGTRQKVCRQPSLPDFVTLA